MILLRLAAWTCWFMLCAVTYAHADPITAAIGAIGAALKAGGIAATLIKLAITAALQVGTSLLKRAMEKKQPQPGISGQMQVGGDNSYSFIVGTYATAGSLDYVGTWGRAGKTPNAYLTQVLTVSDHRQTQLNSRIFINNDQCTIDFGVTPVAQGYPVTEFRRNGRDYLWVKVLDGSQLVADPFLMSAFNGDPDRPWMSDMIGTGATVVLLTALVKRELFTGFPVGRYQPGPLPLYDPRKDSTVGGSGTQRWGQPASYAPTSNPMVITYNAFRGIYYGTEKVFGLGVSAARLPLAPWFTAMNECDLPITLQGGGTEPQFTAGFEIKVAEHEPADVIEEMLKSCNGQIAEIGGVYKPRVGPPTMPVMFVTDEDFIVTDPQEMDPFKGLEATFNGATASYPDPAAAWEMKDAPQRLFPAYEAEDDGRRLLANFQFSAVSSPTQVQRLMQSMVRDGRNMRSHRGTLPPIAFGLEPLDVISWTSSRNGYVNKLFDVQSKDEMANVNQSLAFVETDPADYNWVPSDTLPWSVGPVAPTWPAPMVISGWGAFPAIIYDSAGVARRPSIRVQAANDLEDVRNVRVQVRKAGATAIDFDSDALPYDVPYEWILNGTFLPNQAYEVRGRAVLNSAIDTGWSGWIAVTTPDVRLPVSDIYLPGVVDELLVFVDDAMAWATTGTREVLDSVRQLIDTVQATAVTGYTDKQTLRTELVSTTGDLAARFTDEITVATSATAAVAMRVTSLETTLPGLATASALDLVVTQVSAQGGDISALAGRISSVETTLPGLATSSALDSLATQVSSQGGTLTAYGTRLSSIEATLPGLASASAVTALTTRVTSAEGAITSQGNAITQVNSTVGNFSASGLFRVETESTPSGAQSRIGLYASATGGESSTARSAALFLEAVSGGTSRVVIQADQFSVLSGSTRRYPFIISGGVVYANEMRIGFAKIDDVQITGNLVVDGTLTAANIGFSEITGSTSRNRSASGSSPAAGWTDMGTRWTFNNQNPNTVLTNFTISATAGRNPSGSTAYTVEVRLFNVTDNVVVATRILGVPGGSSSRSDSWTDLFTFEPTPGSRGNKTYAWQYNASFGITTFNVSASSTQLWWNR